MEVMAAAGGGADSPRKWGTNSPMATDLMLLQGRCLGVV